MRQHGKPTKAETALRLEQVIANINKQEMQAGVKTELKAKLIAKIAEIRAGKQPKLKSESHQVRNVRDRSKADFYLRMQTHGMSQRPKLFAPVRKLGNPKAATLSP